jgi:hypothetical protein
MELGACAWLGVSTYELIRGLAFYVDSWLDSWPGSWLDLWLHLTYAINTPRKSDSGSEI